MPTDSYRKSLRSKLLCSFVGAAALVGGGHAAAQSPECGGFLATDSGSVRLIDLSGNQVFLVTTTTLPTTRVTAFGPRLVITEQAGTRIFDRFGFQLGALVAATGAFQQVELGLDRFVVVNDNHVLLVDRDGNQISAPITRTGARRQGAQVTSLGQVVVIDDDRVRIFDRGGNRIGAPILTSGARAWVTTTKSGLVIVTDDQGVRIFDKDGVQRGAQIPTRGTNRPSVKTHGGRVIITDDAGTRIFGEDGSYKAEVRKTGTRRQQVVTCGDRIITIDDDRVQVSDLDGFPIGGPVTNATPNQGRQTVTTTSDRILVTDGNNTQVFDKQTLNLITTILRVGLDRQQVFVDGDRILIVEQNQTRIFGSDGLPRGAPIQRTGTDTQSVRIKGGRILIIDSDRVRVFDRSGTQLSQVLTSNVQEFNVELFAGLFTITSDDGYVEIRNANGVLQGQRITVTPAVQHVQVVGDRVLIVDGNQMQLFNRAGARVGNPVRTAGDPEVVPLCWQAGVATSYGRGCGAAGRVPQLFAAGEPIPGGTMSWFVQNARPSAVALLGIGFSDQSWGGLPLPFDLGGLGGVGCSVLAAPEVTLNVLTGASGSAEVALSLVPDASAVGLSLFSQLFVPDPAANSLGFALSNGVRVDIGEGI